MTVIYENPYQSPPDTPTVPAPLPSKCPRCGGEVDHGFVLANKGLSVVFCKLESVLKNVFVPEPVVSAGWFDWIPQLSKWFRAGICRTCRMVMIDYGHKLTHSEAKSIAKNGGVP